MDDTKDFCPGLPGGSDSGVEAAVGRREEEGRGSCEGGRKEVGREERVKETMSEGQETTKTPRDSRQVFSTTTNKTSFFWGDLGDASLPPPGNNAYQAWLVCLWVHLHFPFQTVRIKQEASPLNCSFKLPCLQIPEGGFGLKAGEDSGELLLASFRWEWRQLLSSLLCSSYCGTQVTLPPPLAHLVWGLKSISVLASTGAGAGAGASTNASGFP